MKIKFSSFLELIIFALLGGISGVFFGAIFALIKIAPFSESFLVFWIATTFILLCWSRFIQYQEKKKLRR